MGLASPARAADAAVRQSPAAAAFPNHFAGRHGPTEVSLRHAWLGCRLRRELLEDRHVHELRGSQKHVPHQLSDLDESLLASGITFAGTALLLALEDGEEVDPARLVLLA
jgi:hypothetical protein